ncbi:MAG: 1-deoxy-D-xylulose-5-phosphate synthase [Clostridia bacterium]|nr:1-deoxy-D-xylulose-5-phosphate synthase [Clostridia bacterium]MBQ9998082.1 1-deoxy-D-xylulose-5-phosphate synthase [Clostridia bacterium]
MVDFGNIKELTYEQLEVLAVELRQELLNVVSKNGGHLASNLGAVELTLALHKCYNPGNDKIIWDVGHQSYVHKMLTGRNLENLRTFGGVSGFTRTSESDTDCYDSGHSSTSISTALGYAYARDLKGEDYNVVAVIGDGAMTGGLAFEALNNVSRLKSNVTIVLNDNEMSISKNVGGMSKYLSRIRTGKFYHNAKKRVKDRFGETPFGKSLKHIKDTIKFMFLNDNLFEMLGITTLGPVDGHNVRELTTVFNMAKNIDAPVLVHVITKKGAGYQFAEQNPSKFHGIGRFDLNTGEVLNNDLTVDKPSKVFGETLTQLAEKNNKVVAITAAMPDGTGLKEFAKKYKDRFFDVGIAEGHAVTFAGGLARGGFIPVVAVYSSFLQRAYDNIVHDVAMRNLHVVFAVDRAGLVGEDGESHHGLLDMAYFLSMPNIAVLSPCNNEILKQMLLFAVNDYNGPVAIRYPRSILDCEKYDDFVFGKGCIIREGKDVTVVTSGSCVNKVKDAVNIADVDAEIIDIRTIKPIDKELLLQSYGKTGKIITVEDGTIFGGLGSVVEQVIGGKVIKVGYDNDVTVTHGSINDLEKHYGTDAKSIADIILKEVNGN